MYALRVFTHVCRFSKFSRFLLPIIYFDRYPQKIMICKILHVLSKNSARAKQFNFLIKNLLCKIKKNLYTNRNIFDESSLIPMQSNESMEVFIVSTKVPPFYSAKPDLWFLQVQAQFRNNKIGIYDIVVSNLDPKYLDVIAHFIRNPPDENKYDTF